VPRFSPLAPILSRVGPAVKHGTMTPVVALSLLVAVSGCGGDSAPSRAASPAATDVAPPTPTASVPSRVTATPAPSPTPTATPQPTPDAAAAAAAYLAAASELFAASCTATEQIDAAPDDLGNLTAAMATLAAVTETARAQVAAIAFPPDVGTEAAEVVAAMARLRDAFAAAAAAGDRATFDAIVAGEMTEANRAVTAAGTALRDRLGLPPPAITC
jgi:hypothetical protein